MAKCLTKLLGKRPSSRLSELYITVQPHTFRRFLMRNVLGVGVTPDKKPEELKKPTLRFIQFLRGNDERKRLGVVSEDGNTFAELSGGACVSNDFLAFLKQGFSSQELLHKIDRVQCERMNDRLILLPPIINPGKIICVGLNYKGHCDEQNKQPPTDPVFFSKFGNALVGPLDCVVAHSVTKRLDWEVELAVVISRKCRHVQCKDAMNYVFGYTIAQDISARDWQKRNGGQFFIGKSMDTFCPIGPAVVHSSMIGDPHNLYLKCTINGEEKQSGNTREMIFRIDELISRLSSFLTLLPGDLILTGTPKGVGMYHKPPQYLKVGDVIQSEIQCVGKMINQVIAP
ncbi:fumarylacetoacetate hydrolase domain-containing protein 2 [Glossina fuscipes]|uniref:Fumarylacetoacetate hydrolase domain-containing protein 2 n=1 Tax=Glossina fuscipes TaxID=7396 RepID=A0A8U0WIF1_9MUSC|nr:fumarylacetoacetate hydrolase domain-containing protein 2 [Glossina fuscipes]